MSAHIVVAEDDEDLAMMLKYRLEKAGYEVTVVEDGVEAVRTVTELHPALVLLDAGLPVLDGLGALRQMRADSTVNTLKVVMCTGRDDQRDVRAAIVAGADDYLIKPVAPDTLLSCVARHLTV
jgi:DNA-binding response OmpR family regulator